MAENKYHMKEQLGLSREECFVISTMNDHGKTLSEILLALEGWGK